MRHVILCVCACARVRACVRVCVCVNRLSQKNVMMLEKLALHLGVVLIKNMLCCFQKGFK